MPKGIPNKRYTGEFKQKVVEDMLKNKISYWEAERKYGLPDKRAQSWERIYLTYGAEGLYLERRGRGGKGATPKLPAAVEEDLLAEVQRLRAENDYLKNLHALVSERVRRENGHK